MGPGLSLANFVSEVRHFHPAPQSGGPLGVAPSTNGLLVASLARIIKRPGQPIEHLRQPILQWRKLVDHRSPENGAVHIEVGVHQAVAHTDDRGPANPRDLSLPLDADFRRRLSDHFDGAH